MLAINGSIITAATHSPLVLTPTINPGFYSVNFNAKDQYYYAYNISPYILPDKIRQEAHHDTNRIPSSQDGHQTKQQISYSGSSWRGWLWHYLCRHGRGIVPEGSRQRILSEGSDYEE